MHPGSNLAPLPLLALLLQEVLDFVLLIFEVELAFVNQVRAAVFAGDFPEPFAGAHFRTLQLSIVRCFMTSKVNSSIPSGLSVRLYLMFLDLFLC